MDKSLLERIMEDVHRVYGIGGLVVLLVLVLWIDGKFSKVNAALVAVWRRIKNRPGRRPVKELDLTIRRIDSCIRHILKNLIIKFDADRAYVFEYEEYDKRIKPLPWLYCTCAYEECHPTRAITCEQESLLHIPLDAIPLWKRELGTVGAIRLYDIDDIQEKDLESWKILARQSIRSVYCVGLCDLRGQPIGFLGLDYCTEQRGMSDGDMLDLKMDAAAVGGLLAMRRNGTLDQLAGVM